MIENRRLARRRWLASFATSALTIALPACADRGVAERTGQALGSSSRDRPPWPTVPVGAADCHHHIFDSAYATDPRATNLAADALVADYRRLQGRLGLSRHVLVQPSAYGIDNRCMLDALRQFGDEARGIAVVSADIDDAQLQALHRAGVRGIRFNLQFPVGVDSRTLAPLARRVTPLGWHIEVNATAEQLLSVRAQLAALDCPVVFDHMGQLPQPNGLRHPAFGFMRDMVSSGRAWVKLSGVYQTSRSGPPDYADSSAVAETLIALAPGQLVWGSNWPHPSQPPGRKPDDAMLLDLLARWAPDTETRNAILVANPQRLYGFGSVARTQGALPPGAARQGGTGAVWASGRVGVRTEA